MTPSTLKKKASSFRDPNGFIFEKDGLVLRQVNLLYKENYDHFISSGLYKKLVEESLLVAHEEVDDVVFDQEDHYKTLKPEQVSFISYPYEWSFGQLRSAALLTLRIQKISMEHGMILKDASAFNVQFIGSRAVFIDTLSFEKYTEGRPWVAYRQFCQHFLAPLLLMRYKDISTHKFFRIFLDGIPLSVASKLLPFSTYLKFSSLSHIHLHARVQRTYQDKKQANYKQHLSKDKLSMLIDSLEHAISGLKWNPSGTEWAEYYENTNYSSTAFEAKKTFIHKAIEEFRPRGVWDIGANTGVFSRIASEAGIPTVSFDIDPAAVEKNYRESAKRKEKNILPLIMDVSNPSPGLGWLLEERDSVFDRGPADMTIAVALIHHLTIGGNAPFDVVARFFHRISKVLVIEFVPKQDSQVKRLLASREDIFSDYTQETFEKVFSEYFDTEKKKQVEGSERTLYVMKARP